VSEQPRIVVSHAFLELPENEFQKLWNRLDYTFPILRIDEAYPHPITLNYVKRQRFFDPKGRNDNDYTELPLSVKMSFGHEVLNVPRARLYHVTGPHFLKTSMAIHYLERLYNARWAGRSVIGILAHVNLVQVTPANALWTLVEAESS